MQYEFLKQFAKRMKHVGMYAILLQNSMAKQTWKPGNMVYPAPAVMVSVADKAGNTDIITAAWTGNICSDPAMTYVSVRPERFLII